MTEDFTSTNQKVVNQLIQLEKAKLIKKVLVERRKGLCQSS